MLRKRVIPSLLLKNNGLVKSVRFSKEKYVGDPINAIRLFNDKEADELVVLDIVATLKNSINYELLSRINKEAFMPLAYGGGINTVDDARTIINLGYEKVVLNSAAIKNPQLITSIANVCGSQSTIVCIDVIKTMLGNYKVYQHSTKKSLPLDPMSWAAQVEELGAGEIILYNVDRDGTFAGYDLQLIKRVSSAINIPLIALGGAKTLEDFSKAFNAGADAVAAGSMFVYHGPHKAVLITYPSSAEIDTLF
ncbi:MAG: AglZ/HisF2 family acetamidino modification protein [Syntrophomonas sp.]